MLCNGDQWYYAAHVKNICLKIGKIYGKLKLKMVHKSRSHKRLNVFRQICPSPTVSTDEMDSSNTFSERPMENTVNATVEPGTSAMCQQQQPAQNANGSTHLSTQETNEIVDTDLPDAFMDLSISRQNERPIFSLGSSLTTERNGSLGVRTPEGIVQNPNSNQLLGTTHHNGISEIDINRVNSRDDLPSPSYFLPKDLLDEINDISTCPPTTTDNSQYTLNMPTMTQQPIKVPGNYSTKFGVPYFEPRPMNVKSQSNLLNRMNFSNEFYEQWNNINQQQNLMGTTTFSREFYEQWNHIQQTLAGRMNFSSGLNEQLTNVNQLPPTSMGSMDFPNEFYQQWNNINQSQPTIPNNLNFPNEFYEQMFAGTTPTNDTTNQPQQMLLDRTNFFNEYFVPRSTDDSTLNYGNFCNEFTEPRPQNEMNLPQPSNMHHMNSFNGLTELGSWDQMNLPQPPSADHMNAFNGLATEHSPLKNLNFTQSPLTHHMNSFNGLATNRNFPQKKDHMNSFNGLAAELSPFKNMNVPQPPLMDQKPPSMNSFNGFNGLSQMMPTNFSTQFLEPRQVNSSEPTTMDPMNFSNGFLDPKLINPMNFSQPTLFDNANFYNESTGAGFTNTFNQQPNEMDFINSLMLRMQNLAQNNVNGNTQWPIYQNPLQYYMNLAGENSLLNNTMPRPILSGNYHDEVWTPDLLRNSNADDINSTADYTTEYSMTHAIAAPTMSDIAPTDTYTEGQFAPNMPRPILNRSHLNESAEPYEPRSSLNALAEPYEPQNHTMDQVKPPACPYTESLHLLPRPILNRNRSNECSTSYVSPNPELHQTNYTNPNPHFVNPISYQMNSQNASIAAQNCVIAQRNVMPDCAHSEESPISQLSELSPNDDAQQS